MKIILLSIGIITIVMTLLPLIPSDYWLFRIFDFPRLQITILIIVTLVTSLIFLDKSEKQTIIFLILLTAAVIYQSTLILKFTVVAKNEVIEATSVDSVNSISMLISNVLMDNRNNKGLLKLIEKNDPDIVIAVETDQWWENHLQILEKKYSYQVKYPLDNTYGILLYSKLELVDPKINFLIEKDIPSIKTELKLRSGIRVLLYAVHPTPPAPGQSPTSTERDAELVLVGKEIKKLDRPAIVAGDLNDVAWSHTTRLFQRISGLLDPRVGRGFFNTFSADYPIFRWPLDHVFHSDHFMLEDLRILEDYGSDHFPVYIKLQFSKTADAKQEEKNPEKDDMEEVEETIDDAKED